MGIFSPQMDSHWLSFTGLSLSLSLSINVRGSLYSIKKPQPTVASISDLGCGF